MNINYVIIGTFLLITGLVIVTCEWRKFLKELKENESTSFVLIKGLMEGIFFGGLGFVGLLIILVGMAFFGSAMSLW